MVLACYLGGRELDSLVPTKISGRDKRTQGDHPSIDRIYPEPLEIGHKYGLAWPKANEHIQRKYYLPCTRTLVDYAAPILMRQTEAQKESLEVIQSNAMRLMLGALTWTRLCNLRLETNLPKLVDRITQRNANTMAKMFLSERDSILRKRAREGLAKHPKIQSSSSYGKDQSDNIKRIGMAEILLQLSPDTTQGTQHLPPWKKDTATYKYTNLPRAKEDCTKEELRAAAYEAIRNTEIIGAQTYYINGSVDPENQTTGAAIYSRKFTACWRTFNHSFTMQTELMAIRQAMLYLLENEEGPVIIHTDSKSSMQALQQQKNKESKALLAGIKTPLHQHSERGRPVTLNWIPSHIGIPGNERADELAKSTKYIDRVQIHIQPALQQGKNAMKPLCKENQPKDHHEWIEKNSLSARWYKRSTDLVPPPIDRHTPRKLAVIIHRLRLGYKACLEIVENSVRPCEHCEGDTQQPLLHYLLECREMARLRGAAQIDLNSQDAEHAAATVTKTIIENL
ncbi:uncharacterized protein LOC135223949 [Macrobrachium nipponense]|uniref:uncharacterized protein LOC135223949 n=1 Tax=Macrobrachium nipponense TaxID=159736 RepID=UPI0030C8C160